MVGARGLAQLLLDLRKAILHVSRQRGVGDLHRDSGNHMDLLVSLPGPGRPVVAEAIALPSSRYAQGSAKPAPAWRRATALSARTSGWLRGWRDSAAAAGRCRARWSR